MKIQLQSTRTLIMLVILILLSVVSYLSFVKDMPSPPNQNQINHNRNLQEAGKSSERLSVISEEEIAKATALRGYSITHHSTMFYLRLYGVPSYPASEHQLAIYIQALGYFLTLRFNKYMHKIDWKQTPKVHVDLVEATKQTLKRVGSDAELYDVIGEFTDDHTEEQEYTESVDGNRNESVRILNVNKYGENNYGDYGENVLEIETRVDTRYEVPHDAPDPVLYFYLRMQSVIIETFNNWEYGEKIFLQRLEEQCAKVDTRISSAKGWDYFSNVRHLKAFTEYDLYQDILNKQVEQQRLTNFRKVTYEIGIIGFILFGFLVMSSVVIVLKRRQNRFRNKEDEDIVEDCMSDNASTVGSTSRYSLDNIKQKRRWSIYLFLAFFREVYSHVLVQVKSIKYPKLPFFDLKRLRIRVSKKGKKTHSNRYKGKHKLEYIEEEDESDPETEYESDDDYSSSCNEEERLIETT